MTEERGNFNTAHLPHTCQSRSLKSLHNERPIHVVDFWQTIAAIVARRRRPPRRRHTYQLYCLLPLQACQFGLDACRKSLQPTVLVHFVPSRETFHHSKQRRRCNPIIEKRVYDAIRNGFGVTQLHRQEIQGLLRGRLGRLAPLRSCIRNARLLYDREIVSSPGRPDKLSQRTAYCRASYCR